MKTTTRSSTLLLSLAWALPIAAQNGFDPPLAVDTNPDPDVVEIDLRASVTTWQYLPGIDTTVWAYNDSVPGPTIEAEVGDTLIVHFTNDLPEPTTIHWHGVESPAAMDGAHISQAPIPPGTTFTYEIPLLSAAMFWYHPHVRPFDQVEKGLYGVLMVRDTAKEQLLGLDQIEEHLIVFDDVLLDANHQVVPAFSFTDPLQNALYQLNGREGNHLLVNGREVSSVELPVANGRPQRWRCVNAANTTFARLDVNDAVLGFPDAQLWEIGTDGGFEERPYARFPVKPFVRPPRHPTFSLLGPMGEGIFLMPGERLDVIFTPRGQEGARHTILQHDWIRGRHLAIYGPNNEIVLTNDPNDGFHPPVPYLGLVLEGADPGPPYYAPPENLATRVELPPNPVGSIPVTFGHAPPDPAGNVTFFSQAQFAGGTMTPLPAAKIDSFNAFDVEVGETWDWQITNLSHGDHPFHAHGFFFIPYEYEFQDDLVPQNNFVFRPARHLRKDTIRCPARGGALGTTRTITRLRVVFDDTGREGLASAMGGQAATYAPDGSWTSGGWLFHCHVLEHSAKGMLSLLEVHEPDEVFRLLGKGLAGTRGLPYLTAAGDLSPGTPVGLAVTNALPSHACAIVGGTSSGGSPLLLPFAGGTVVPSLEAIVVVPTDANGEARFDVLGWEGTAPGTEIYVQAAFPDAGAPRGVAFTNALKWTRP